MSNKSKKIAAQVLRGVAIALALLVGFSLSNMAITLFFEVADNGPIPADAENIAQAWPFIRDGIISGVLLYVVIPVEIAWILFQFA